MKPSNHQASHQEQDRDLLQEDPMVSLNNNQSMPCSRNSTPVMLGILWSTRSNASDSFRSFSCFSISKAVRPESARSTLNSLPYLLRKSRSTDFKTCGSSSTVRITGFIL